MEFVILKALMIIIPIWFAVVILWYGFYIDSYIDKSKRKKRKKNELSD